MLSLVVEVGGACMHILHVAEEPGFLVLGRHDIFADSVHECVDDSAREVLGLPPRARIFLFDLVQGFGACGFFAGFDVHRVRVVDYVLAVLGHVEFGGGALLQVFTCHLAAVVVLDDFDLLACGEVGDGAALEQGGSKEDVVPAECPVFFDELTVEEGEEEGNDYGDDTAGNPEDRAADLAHVPVIDVEGGGL